MCKSFVLLLYLILILTSCLPDQNVKSKFDKIDFSYSELKEMEPDSTITRRGPSDVISYQGKYYVWYTKTDKGNSGYDATIWYAETEDGYKWNEIGEELGRGVKGSWDEYSVFTPNILFAKGKYYLFYTAVKRTQDRPDYFFENNSHNDFTSIGIASSNSPLEPFIRIEHNPILSVSKDSKVLIVTELMMLVL